MNLPRIARAGLLTWATIGALLLTGCSTSGNGAASSNAATSASSALTGQRDAAGGDVVDLIFRYRVKPGGEAKFQQYLDKVLPATQKEPYVLTYEIYKQGDGSYLQRERYENEAAIAKHLEVTAEGQADWAEATELTDIRVLGKVSTRFLTDSDIPTANNYQLFRQINR